MTVDRPMQMRVALLIAITGGNSLKTVIFALTDNNMDIILYLYILLQIFTQLYLALLDTLNLTINFITN